MPVYEYECPEHGTFTRKRDSKKSGRRASCPICRKACWRSFGSVQIPRPRRRDIPTAPEPAVAAERGGASAILIEGSSNGRIIDCTVIGGDAAVTAIDSDNIQIENLTTRQTRRPIVNRGSEIHVKNPDFDA